MTSTIEFGSGNGRHYTLGLKITLRQRYSDAKLAQLYDALDS